MATSAKRASSAPAIFVRLAGWLRPYRRRVALAAVTFIAAGLTLLALGQGVRALVDHGLHQGAGLELRRSVGVLLLLVAIYGLSALGRAYLSASIGGRIAIDIRSEVFRRLLGHGPAFFETEGGNKLWSRVMSDTALIQSMIAAGIVAFRNGLIVVGGLYVMLTTSVALTATVLVLAPAITYTMVYMGRRAKRLSDEAQVIAADSDAFVLETLDGIRMVKAFSGEAQAYQTFDRLAAGAFALSDRRNAFEGLMNGVSIWMIFGSAVLLGGIGGDLIVRGQISEGAVSAFLFYAVITASAGAALSDGWGQLQRGLGAAERLFALIDLEPEIRSPAVAKRLSSRVEGELGFEDVSFHYPQRPDVAALRHINARVRAKSTVALVGPSGAGKSTLFQLLLRLYDPSQGRILLDGLDIRDLDPTELRSQISIVPQDPALFQGSLLDNIRFSRQSASMAEVEKAASAAQAMEFIEALPEGLYTQVGPRGVQLSGGQRQRIAIARAILRNPRILLLDEATNALDAQSEHRVQQALKTLSGDRTTLVIAHKLATVQRADCILVLEHGQVTAMGTHTQLLSEEGRYVDFARLQLVHD